MFLPLYLAFALSPHVADADEFRVAFDGPDLSMWHSGEGASWAVNDDVLISPMSGGVPGMLVAGIEVADVRLSVDVMLPETGRRNPALVFRMTSDGTGYVVRWYDQRNWLELMRYENGEVMRINGNHWQASSPEGSVPQEAGRWHTMALEAVGDRVRAKAWPREGQEPEWQLEAECLDTSPGAFGIGADETVARFDNFVALTERHIADLLREARKRKAAARHRREQMVLREGPGLEYGLVAAEFHLIDRVPGLGVDLLFRARDAGNSYFARAADGSIAVGKVLGGQETILAVVDSDWYDGPGLYRIEALVTEARRDDRGAAWFLNREYVPPMVTLRARVARAGEPQRAWAVAARDDPVIPGNKGEPYWHLDPFATSSAQAPLGEQVGWRKAPGVVWSGINVAERQEAPVEVASVSPVLRIPTRDRGGCWLAVGDLDGDGRLDYLAARNQAQSVTALTAYGNDGHELWRWGEGGEADIGYDVPATIYDVDHDGQAEALCSIEGYVLVLDGRTGAEEMRWALPEGLQVADCIIIADLRGRSEPSDVIIKTRYDHIWAYTSDWDLLWEFEGNTGHHPDVADVDGDGRDEVLCGFTLLDHDGTVLWQKDLPGHADCARLAGMASGGPVRALNSCCGGNDLAPTAISGESLWRQRPEVTDFHFQTAHVGEIRPDVPGHEIVVDEGWAYPGRARLTVLSARGEWIGTFYVSYPRFHRIIDWDADGVMEIAIPSDGMICSGRGRPVVQLAEAPPLGGPGVETPMAHVADVMGDGRDELILFNATEIVVYTDPSPTRPRTDPRPAVMKRYYNATYY